MEQSPYWEANRFSASQEIPHILWKPKVHYSIHLPLSSNGSIQSMSRNPLPKDPSEYYHPIYICVFLVASLLQVSPQKPCITLIYPL